MLVLLSDIDGLYSADPKKDVCAQLIPVVEAIDENIVSLAGGAGSSFGTGGMATKLKAAKICTDNAIDMVITNGAYPENLYKAVEGINTGTRFLSKK